jgi:Ca2+-binding RTX toxin-like protein
VRGDVNRDRIRLGAGVDTASLVQGADHRRAFLTGGPGPDQLQLMVRDGALHVDSAAESATHRGATYATWRSFEAHAMYSDGAQVFTGSEGDDEVYFGGWGAVTAMTLGGDDAVHLSVEADVPTSKVPERARSSARSPASRVTIDMGHGRDELALTSWDALVRADLALARVDLSSGAEATGSFGFSGVEDLTVHAGIPSRREPPTRVVLIGDDHDNRLQADGCHVELTGGGGNDHLRVGSPPPDSFIIAGGPQPKTCRRSSLVDGGTGDDVLISRAMDVDLRGVDVDDLGAGDRIRYIEVPVRDVLNGGEGNDTAHAGKGTDICVAEVRVGCER